LTGWFPPNRRATATGLYLVGGATGSVFFNLVGPLLVARWDWRVAFISVASVGIIAVLFLWRYGKDSPTMAERQKGSLFGAFKLFRNNLMLVCGIIQFIRLGVMLGITFWLPSLLVNEKGFSLDTAGIIMAVQSVLMVPSNILGGYISDRLKNPPLVIGVSLCALGITTVLLINADNPALVVALIFINALFLQMYFGPLFSVPVEVLGESHAGVSAGFSNFFANLGGFSSTFLLGVIKDATGAFRPGFLAISGACVVGLIFTLVLARIRRRAIIAAKSG
jgi:MFS transporter, ACS family, D-galactonate transporter